MRTEEVNLPPEGSERSDAATGSPIGPEPRVGELASTTVRATSPKPVGWLRKRLKIFGPGLITGAADDDPSGIATYAPGGRSVWSEHALDNALNLPVHGGYSGNKSPKWDG